MRSAIGRLSITGWPPGPCIATSAPAPSNRPEQGHLAAMGHERIAPVDLAGHPQKREGAVRASAVRSDGGTVSASAIGPSPLAEAPWQTAQKSRVKRGTHLGILRGDRHGDGESGKNAGDQAHGKSSLCPDPPPPRAAP
jgi:hypothetical protein